jgi:hypothetical protein
VHARLVYSVFLVFTLAGLALTMVLLHDMVGIDLARAADYYGGEAVPPEEPPPLDGPDIELPGDLAASSVALPMARRKLLEVSHFHLFSMPVYLLVLAHLFALSTVGNRGKMLWIGAGTVGTLLHLVAPWVAASGAGGAVLLYGTSGALLLVSYLVMSMVPLWEMWMPPSAG